MSTEVNRNKAGMTVFYFPILSLVFNPQHLGVDIFKKKKSAGVGGGKLEW